MKALGLVPRCVILSDLISEDTDVRGRLIPYIGTSLEAFGDIDLIWISTVSAADWFEDLVVRNQDSQMPVGHLHRSEVHDSRYFEIKFNSPVCLSLWRSRPLLTITALHAEF
jgi:hypothetical protein